ncbi:MAG: septum formation initiator family protein [Microbacteriaceae bacterium]|nr:septum formation initiator family protein [Microbacteriaceae bacterium]HPZ35382.1 septum formation initiator family protein [Microbacteriaceae bacterium]HQC93137.1 septum formation initiator family protein [Microbacteriaceae bacterium]
MARVATPRRVDVRGWLGGIRRSGFVLIMMSLVVLAALVLMPTLGTYLEQRQRIAALEHAIAADQATIDALIAERERWSDPAYITTQARERLYYVQPGEVVYLVDNDLDLAHQPTERPPVSEEVTTTHSDWMSQLLRSITSSGVAEVVAPITIGVPDQPAPEDQPASEAPAAP